MHKLYVFALLPITLLVSLLTVQYSHAISTNLVISQIRAGNSATNRLIEIYNNSDVPVDITSWCLYYSSPSNTFSSPNLGCFENANLSVHIFINARSFALLASAQTGLLADIVLTSGLGSGVSGHVYLMDSAGNEVDRVGWGLAVNAEANHPVPLDATKVIERKQDPETGYLIDTDDNQNDFMSSTLRTEYQYGALYEVIDLCSNISGVQDVIPTGYEVDDIGNCTLPPVDVCLNLDGMQTEIPSGYMIDVDDCILIPIDICDNIDGLQLAVPDGMELDENGDCIQYDECSNLPEIQTVIPDEFTRGVDNSCVLGLLPLQLSELLPNAVGIDKGSEFIEIYNPNDSDVNLLYYFIYIGSDYEHFYSFPVGSHIDAGQYMSFSDKDIGFTLVNTTSSVRLRPIDNSFIDETPAYDSPGEGMAWALIDDVWQYTNRPTPGSVNLPTLLVKAKIQEPVVVKTETVLKPCAANQYRSPETNRCRLKVIVPSSTPTPCKDDQYRSEETGRCRNIVSDIVVITPCAEGQERNPETNRCRSVAAVLGATDLALCKEGQERNPDTNRCRNIISSIPQAEFAPEQTSELSNNYVGWWSLAGVGVVAVIYGIWEWRQEIRNLVRKLGSFRHSKK